MFGEGVSLHLSYFPTFLGFNNSDALIGVEVESYPDQERLNSRPLSLSLFPLKLNPQLKSKASV